jgi:hypothetical protein
VPLPALDYFGSFGRSQLERNCKASGIANFAGVISSFARIEPIWNLHREVADAAEGGE